MPQRPRVGMPKRRKMVVIMTQRRIRRKVAVRVRVVKMFARGSFLLVMTVCFFAYYYNSTRWSRFTKPCATLWTVTLHIGNNESDENDGQQGKEINHKW